MGICNFVKRLLVICVFMAALVSLTWAANLFIESAVAENYNLEVFNDRSDVQTLLLSDDGKTLWVESNGGLEERSAVTGELKRVYNEKSGLPDNDVESLLSDGNGGLWVGTYKGGLAHLKADNTWQVFNKDNSGLLDNDVESLLSDGNGGLWVGTYKGGLAHLKADNTWQVFNKDNSGMPSNNVGSLLSDGSGGIWVGTGGGLAHYKADGSWQVFNKDNSGMPDNDVESLLSDGQNGLWVGTYWGRGGLAHYKADGTWQVFNTENSGLPDNSVTSLLSDDSGGIWVGTVGWNGGLAHYKADGTWQVFNTDNSGLPYNYVNSLLSDGNGGLWVGTGGGGLAHLKADSTWGITSKNRSELFLNGTYYKSKFIYSDNEGGMWVRTDSETIAHFKSDGVWNVFGTKNSGLPEKDIYSLLSDSQGGIWMWTEINSIYDDAYGLAHMGSDGKWELLNTENSDLPDNKISETVSDSQGGIWVGTLEGGLAHLKSDRTWDVFNKTNSGLPDNRVDVLCSDNQGGIWVFKKYVGLAHLKADHTWKIFNIEYNPLLHDNWDISLLEPDGQGGLWAGIGIGLGHLKADGIWYIYSKTNSQLPDNTVTSILSDGNGGAWVGTYSKNLAHLNADGTWKLLDGVLPDAPSSSSILPDGNGGVWVGTDGGGLVNIKKSSLFTFYRIFNTENSNLPDNRISSILSDNNGGVWFRTWGDGFAHLASSSVQVQQEEYLTGNRAAIIIAGGGNTDDNVLWNAVEKSSNYIYKMFNRRGFLNSDIHYLSPEPFADFNGDGFDDSIVDAPNPARQLQVPDIQDAFDWAKTKGQLNQPLYIFFTGNGVQNRLQLANGVYIEATELKTMVDDYQQTTKNKVILIIDASHSGTMIQSLAGIDRAIIASTDEGLARFDTEEGMGFNYFLANGLLRGMSFLESFQYAEIEHNTMLSEMDIDSYASGYTRKSQFDDNGDGLANTSDDGNWLKDVMVNGSIIQPTANHLQVEPVTESGNISAFDKKIILKAKATSSAGRVSRVWALIHPPQMTIYVDDNGIQAPAFPKVQLGSSDSNSAHIEDENVWQGTWNGFVYNGEYKITFYAADNQGAIEISESIKLTVDDGMACPEKASLKMSCIKQPDNTGKIVYKSGDTLKISVNENLAYGYDLYVALFMPDGNFVALKSPLKDSSSLQKENFNRLYGVDKWIDMNREMGRPVNVVDMMLPQEKLPSGQYCLYAALIPQGENLVTAAGKVLFVLDGVCFEIF